MVKPRNRNLDDIRRHARRRMPRVAFDFVDGGAEDELTLLRNRTAFDDLALVPRVLAGVKEVSTTTHLFGQPLTMPILLAPAGAVLVVGGDADAAAMRGGEIAGVLSVQAWRTPVRPSTDDPSRQWFQLYLTRDRERLKATVLDAKQAGFSALVVTGDVPVAGNRERDNRNGLTVPLRLLTPRIAADAARRPAWLWRYLNSDARGEANMEFGIRSKIREVQSLSDAVRSAFNPSQSWRDLEWIRELWDGPLLLKGVMSGGDAERALRIGCDGIIVSNHGGRQLDSLPASIEMVPEVAAAVGERVPILVDGGIRRGTDIAKALSLGASACLVGRPWVFATALGGEQAVVDMLSTLQAELTRTLHLLGIGSVHELGPQLLRRRPGAGWQIVPSHPGAGIEET